MMTNPLALMMQGSQQDPELEKLLRQLGLLPPGGGPMQLPVPGTPTPPQTPPQIPPTQAPMPPQVRPQAPAPIQAPAQQPGIGTTIGYQAPSQGQATTPGQASQKWAELMAAMGQDRRASDLATQLAMKPPTMGTARKEIAKRWGSKGKLGKVGMVLREALKGFGQQEKYTGPVERAYKRQMGTWQEQGKQAAGAARIAGLTERAEQTQRRQYAADLARAKTADEKQKLAASLGQANVRIKGLKLEQESQKLKYKVASDNRDALMKYEKERVNMTPKNVEQSLVRDAWTKYPEANQDAERQAYINIGREKQLKLQAKMRALYAKAGGGPPKGLKMTNVKDISAFNPATDAIIQVTSGIEQEYNPKTNGFTLVRQFSKDAPEGIIPLNAEQAVTAKAFQGSLSQVYSSVGTLTNAVHKGGAVALQMYGLTSGTFATRLRQLFGGKQNELLGVISPENALLRIAAPNQVWLHARALTRYRPSIEMVKELTKAINASSGTIEAKLNAALALKIATELALYNDLGLITLRDVDNATATAKIATAMTKYMNAITRGESPTYPHVLDIFEIEVPGRNITGQPTVGKPIRDQAEQNEMKRIAEKLAGAKR